LRPRGGASRAGRGAPARGLGASARGGRAAARGGGAPTRWPFAAVADGSRLNHSRRWAITSRANRAPARWFKVEPSSPAGNNGSEPLAAPANGSRLNHPPLARKDRPAEARAPPAPTPRALRTPHRRRAPPSTHDGVRHPRAHGLAVQPRDSGRAAGGGERRGAAGHVAIQDAHAGPV